MNIGFSLRALGSVEPLSDGTLRVKAPIMPITYDVVSNPSHVNARVMDFLPESDMSLFENAEALICEGTEFELLKEDKVTLSNGTQMVRKFIDDVIAEQFMGALLKVKFRL